MAIMICVTGLGSVSSMPTMKAKTTASFQPLIHVARSTIPTAWKNNITRGSSKRNPMASTILTQMSK